ncbi:MAG: hypothetical protein VZR56_04735 [Treponema sp.]|nr:hypothetical protein [Treponema sp.]
MKKILFIICASVLFYGCSSISFHPEAYVESFENYDSFEIKTTNFEKREINCAEYQIKFQNVSNKVSQSTILGFGKKKGVISQKGTVYKNGSELFDVTFINEINDFIREKFTSETILTDSKITMLLNEHLIEFLTEEDGFLIKEHGSFDYSISQISTYKNEHGKIYNMAFDVVMGARIDIDENLYAVIDYYSNPSKIRLNRDFSGDLSEEERDFLFALMLCVYHYETYFVGTTSNDA